MTDIAKDFSELAVPERNYMLRLRTAAEREALLRAYVDSEYIRITDVLQLDEAYRQQCIQMLVGDPTLGYVSSGKIFYIKPTGEPVSLCIGTSQNQRIYITIKGVTPFPADKAIYALLQYGEGSNKKTMRGRLVEVAGPDEKRRK